MNLNGLHKDININVFFLHGIDVACFPHGIYIDGFHYAGGINTEGFLHGIDVNVFLRGINVGGLEQCINCYDLDKCIMMDGLEIKLMEVLLLPMMMVIMIDREEYVNARGSSKQCCSS